MKVKINNKIYDAEDQPIMLILSKSDKRNLRNMHPDATKYCAYPESHSSKKIKKWMKESAPERPPMPSTEPVYVEEGRFGRFDKMFIIAVIGTYIILIYNILTKKI